MLKKFKMADGSVQEGEEVVTGAAAGEGEGEGGEGEGVKSFTVEEVKAMMKEAAEDTFEKKADAIAEKLVAKFQDGVAAQRAKAIEGQPVEKNEKADAKTRSFMLALLSKDVAALKAMEKAVTTGTGSSSPDDAKAGYTVPSELMAEVLRIAAVAGVARRNMRYLPFSGPGNSRTIPALGTSVSVFWTNEGAAKKGTQPKFTLVTQTLKKLAAIVPFTEEILEDSAINLTALVGELFGEAIAVEEDAQYLAGSGSPWTGVLLDTNCNQVTQGTGTSITGLTADDLLDVIDATPAGALDGSKWYMNRTVFNKLRKLKDVTSGQYIVQAPTGNLPGTIWNYPYELVEAMPTAANSTSASSKYLFFGNLKKAAILGDKQALRVKLLEEATITDTDDSTPINLAEQDMVAIRVVSRQGYVLALPKAVTVLKTKAA